MSDELKILLVEDDVNLGSLLKEFLSVKGFDVTVCLNGDEGLKQYNNEKYDLLILDIMMPKKDGFTLAKEIKTIDEQIPIIFLTAKSMQDDKIKGLKLGADDYITKPFSMEELLLRINGILKRINVKKEMRIPELFELGKYKFDSLKRILLINESVKKLTSKENELLKLLSENKNQIVVRSLALNKIWKDDNYFNARSMDVYITKLRSYLKDDDTVEIINIHGEGYKLVC